MAWERMQEQEMKMSGSKAVGTQARNTWEFHCQMERVQKQLFVIQQITGSPKPVEELNAIRVSLPSYDGLDISLLH